MKSFIFLYILSIGLYANISTPWTNKISILTHNEKAVMVDKYTEPPFSGKLLNQTKRGEYHCKLCDNLLFKSNDKFKSHCGWPSFDDAIKGAINQIPDSDGRRVEIVCARCNGHLGHIFKGEKLTQKDTRYCVNSLSLKFVENSTKYKKAYFAGGCFWGVEYYLEKLKGVKEVTSGYMGGDKPNPSYNEVSRHKTKHIESVEVIYNPKIISYKTLAKMFFEIHDPTQTNGQGNDIGSQYTSAVFVSSKKERQTIENLIKILSKKGFKVATKIISNKQFYNAEDYHQDHYKLNGKKPYCHTRIKRF